MATAPSLPPVSRCRSCGAPVYWLAHERTGKTAPINATPDPERGSIEVNRDRRTYAILPVHRAIAARYAAPDAVYTNHFMTCPHAGQHKSGQYPKGR